MEGDEGGNYSENEIYLARNEYHDGATKAEKGKRAKKFRMVDGLLHY